MARFQKKAKPLTWATLPIYAPRCAKAPGIPDDAPVYQMNCVECRETMWTRDSKREDICETCDYTVRERIRQMGAEKRKQNADRLVVPGTGDGGFINPLKSGGGLF